LLGSQEVLCHGMDGCYIVQSLLLLLLLLLQSCYEVVWIFYIRATSIFMFAQENFLRMLVIKFYYVG